MAQATRALDRSLNDAHQRNIRGNGIVAKPGENIHQPAMLEEVLALLAGINDGVVVDATLGLGGHAQALLTANPSMRLVGIDRDTEALTLARRRLQPFADRVSLVHSDFRSLTALVKEAGWQPLRAILFDLGVSSLQLDSASRGFSFRLDGPLDMRMDASTTRTAADLVNKLEQHELTMLIRDYGEERYARRVARAIISSRQESPIDSTLRLASIIADALPRTPARTHPATRTFQALRIAVNEEIDSLQAFFVEAAQALKPGGRLIVIAFHSLEDRPIKRAMRYLASDCECPPEIPQCVCSKETEVRLLTPRPLRPGASEINNNPRARSARMRALERL